MTFSQVYNVLDFNGPQYLSGGLSYRRKVINKQTRHGRSRHGHSVNINLDLARYIENQG